MPLAVLSPLLLGAAMSEPVEVTVRAERDRNLLRNGSFEFDYRYNGMKTTLSQGDQLCAQWGGHQRVKWCETGLEQWWGEGVSNACLYVKSSDAFSGRRSLEVTAPGAATTWLVYVQDVPKDGIDSVTLSCRAKARGAAARICMETALHEGAAPLSQEPVRAKGSREVEVAADAWSHVSFTLEIPKKARKPKKPAFAVRLAVLSGTCAFDDVQLEFGRVATPFSERQDHYLSLSFDGTPESELPMFKHGRDGKKNLVVRNTSGKRLSGTLRVFVDSWDRAGRTLVKETRCADWEPGGKKTVAIDVGSLAPDGYVAIASMEPYFDESGAFDASNTGWGVCGWSQLPKRNGMRFCVFGKESPRDLFGVGNGMIDHENGGWCGNSMENAVRGKSVHPVLIGSADPFKAAVIGAPRIRETGLGRGGGPNNPEANNPVAPNLVNAYSPAGRKLLSERAVAFGREVADDPSVAGAKLDNEGFFVNRGKFCPDKWADADFRAWTFRRYNGDLAQLNSAWKTAIADWKDVVQPISSVTNGTVTKTGGEAVDWTASMGLMTKDAEKRLTQMPGCSLDWFRWRAFSVIRLYGDFIRDAHTVDGKTLYGNNYPWPNYFTHIIWPQWRTHDVIMLDIQYICGFARTLGTNEEMIDILEQAESVSRGERPTWGREIYFQPHYPGEVAALQNWAMIAHGMSVPMTFAWRPYSDYNRKIFKTGVKSWLRDDAPPMWLLIDVDGSAVPGYGPTVRSTDEIAAFHRKFGGLSLRRIPGDVALYLSTDESAYIMFETMDRPYDSSDARNRTAMAAALRYGGARVEYFDDATLGEVTPEKFPVLVAPGEKVVSGKAEALLRRYAENGGSLVVLNDFNALDEKLDPKPSPGVAGWKGDVRQMAFKGKYDKRPYNTEEYDMEIARFFEGNSRIPRRAYWENEEPRRDGEENLLPGEGRPVVEVVVREQERTGLRFAFVLNKGGAGKGRLRGDDFADVKLEDALTGESVPLTFELPAFGYRVFVLHGMAKGQFDIGGGVHGLVGNVVTSRLQARIDELARNGGGELVLSSGTYLSGALFFKPGVNLRLEDGAMLIGTGNKEDYPMCKTRLGGLTVTYYPALVNADGCDGFRISGNGVIDGNGLPVWKEYWAKRKTKAYKHDIDPDLVRPRLVYVSNSRDVDISGVTLRDSRFWTLHLYKCSDVYVHDCRIEARILEGVKGPSTDAIDLDVVTNAVIRRVYMNVNDDAVVLKGGRGPWADDPVRHPDNGGNSNILVEDCTFGSTCHACLTLGSECIGADNVVMRNCHVENAVSLLWMKMRPDTHFEYRNVMISNLTGCVGCGISALPWRQYFDLEGRVDLPMSHIANVTVKCPDLFSNKPLVCETADYFSMTNVTSEMKSDRMPAD